MSDKLILAKQGMGREEFAQIGSTMNATILALRPLGFRWELPDHETSGDGFNFYAPFVFFWENANLPKALEVIKRDFAGTWTYASIEHDSYVSTLILADTDIGALRIPEPQMGSAQLPNLTIDFSGFREAVAAVGVWAEEAAISLRSLRNICEVLALEDFYRDAVPWRVGRRVKGGGPSENGDGARHFVEHFNRATSGEERRQSLGANARRLASHLRAQGKPEEAERIEGFIRDRQGVDPILGNAEQPATNAERRSRGILTVWRPPVRYGRKVIFGMPANGAEVVAAANRAGFFVEAEPVADRPLVVSDGDFRFIIEDTPTTWRFCRQCLPHLKRWDFENAIEVRKSQPEAV